MIISHPREGCDLYQNLSQITRKFHPLGGIVRKKFKAAAVSAGTAQSRCLGNRQRAHFTLKGILFLRRKPPLPDQPPDDPVTARPQVPTLALTSL